jgi:hypothetical protein
MLLIEFWPLAIAAAPMETSVAARQWDVLILELVPFESIFETLIS